MLSLASLCSVADLLRTMPITVLPGIEARWVMKAYPMPREAPVTTYEGIADLRDGLIESESFGR